jgi:hypothetical protein
MQNTGNPRRVAEGGILWAASGMRTTACGERETFWGGGTCLFERVESGRKPRSATPRGSPPTRGRTHAALQHQAIGSPGHAAAQHNCIQVDWHCPQLVNSDSGPSRPRATRRAPYCFATATLGPGPPGASDRAGPRSRRKTPGAGAGGLSDRAWGLCQAAASIPRRARRVAGSIRAEVIRGRFISGIALSSP